MLIEISTQAVEMRLLRTTMQSPQLADIYVGQKIGDYTVTETNELGYVLHDGTNSVRITRGTADNSPTYQLIRLDTAVLYRMTAGETAVIDGISFRLKATTTNMISLVNEETGNEIQILPLTDEERERLRTSAARGTP